MQHISGRDVDVMVGTTLVNVKSFSLNIEDGTKPTSTRGVTNGYVGGDTSASGEIVVDTENLKLIMQEARQAGSFQQMEPFDIVGTGETLSQSYTVAAYGCKLKLNKVLEANSEGGDKLEHSIPYDVTDSRFVEIDDVPYLDQTHAERLGL
jgi:hypothetical protein